MKNKINPLAGQWIRNFDSEKTEVYEVKNGEVFWRSRFNSNSGRVNFITFMQEYTEVK